MIVLLIVVVDVVLPVQVHVVEIVIVDVKMGVQMLAHLDVLLVVLQDVMVHVLEPV